METLREKRISSTGIKEKSWKQYARNINRIATSITGKPYTNNDFLLNYSVVNEWINSNSNSDAMKRMFYSVILIMLAPDKKDVEAQNKMEYKHYQKKLATLALAYNETKATQVKSVKENVNWIDWFRILAFQKKYAREMFKMVKTLETTPNRKQFTIIQNALMLALYTIIKPRRLDYANMIVITRNQYNKMDSWRREESNYLVITGKNKKFFSFGRVAQKNQNTDKNGVKQPVYKLPVPPKLNKIINTFLQNSTDKRAEFDNVPLLYNTRGGAISGDGLSKAILKLMKARFNKNISPTMLRTIYLSDKHKNDISVEEKQTTAEEMGHTIDTAQKFYQKK